ncbi:hypothetical protein A0H81_01920 [Grifola frondosa]|uniref:Uncharacterized protein n=1 Tax=Grifola frondosa TaxID=5627 RepID=A0A1C7MN34_GRIFR|nr:hypothetical protein A0H81_01920 [Grifola frondosa]
MTEFAPLSASKLRDELLTHPLMLSVGSFSLSTFMSRSIYGMIDWRPVLICVASDILAIGIDHYFDQAAMLSYALKTGNREMASIFTQARVLLFSNAALLFIALALSPPWTWAMVVIFFGPAFVWDFRLFAFGPRLRKEKRKDEQKKEFTIKRVPGMKAVFIGVIRGCGTFAIVNSILSHSMSDSSSATELWSPVQIILWSTINRACHAVMADVRDFHEDWEKQVPTIPVLLKSVFRTKILLSVCHLLTMWVFRHNPYIVCASVYATVLVWMLDENSPRGLYRLSFHSQTLTAFAYGAIEAYKYHVTYKSI